MTSLMTTEKNWHQILHTQEVSPSISLSFSPSLSQSLCLCGLKCEDLWHFLIFAVTLSCLLRAEAVRCVCVFGRNLSKAYYVLLADSGLVSLLFWIQHELSARDPRLHLFRPEKQLPLNDCRCFQPTQAGETSAKPSLHIYNSASRCNGGKYRTITDFNCHCCFSVISK